MSLRLFVAASLIFSILSCGVQKAKLPAEFFDPYLRSLMDKNIRYVILERQDRQSIPDTFLLDKQGRILEFNSAFLKQRRSYSTNGFLIREWSSSDITDQYVITYYETGDSLVQTWRSVFPTRWDVTSDTVSKKHHEITFTYDQEGRIAFEMRNSTNERIHYLYNGEQVIKKEVFSHHPEKYRYSWTYEYDKKGALLKMSSYFDNGEHLETFFVGGVPDSLRSSRNGIYKYRYVYY